MTAEQASVAEDSNPAGAPIAREAVPARGQPRARRAAPDADGEQPAPVTAAAADGDRTLLSIVQAGEAARRSPRESLSEAGFGDGLLWRHVAGLPA